MHLTALIFRWYMQEKDKIKQLQKTYIHNKSYIHEKNALLLVTSGFLVGNIWVHYELCHFDLHSLA
jgi:hypothetical protein